MPGEPIETVFSGQFFILSHVGVKLCVFPDAPFFKFFQLIIDEISVKCRVIIYISGGKNMKLTFLDLKSKPDKLFEALKRQEEITLSREGKDIAYVIPLNNRKKLKVSEHPAFGIWKKVSDQEDVPAIVRNMRRGRFDDL
jgi:antitoxin (DNA-binding transcriptional repressor) of toxin-antitoxin stability system